MSWLNLTDIGAMAGGVLHGENCMVNGVGIDTRNLRDGELFVALRGERFDGHDFVAESENHGAAAAMVERKVSTRLPQILVDDTLTSLGNLAGAWRKCCTVICVALTGSNGKTTTKEMLASILRCRFKVVSTKGNLNNQIGVALTLLEFRKEHEAAVVEMGANRAGEIAYLSQMVNPTVGMILNVGGAHLEGFGSLDGVARAKGELFECMGDDGVGVINVDDAYYDYWRDLLDGRRVITFGLENGRRDADVTGKSIDATTMVVNVAGETRSLRLALLGKHNVCNAIAAAAAAYGAGARIDDIVGGLEAMRPVPGRLYPFDGVGGARLIDDSYNANPASFVAAIAVLGEFQKERWLVIGGMEELGDMAQESHAELGRLAKRQRVSRLFACGDLSRAAVESFGQGARHFTSNEALSKHLTSCLSGDKGNDVAILVKGSRSAHMEEIVQALRLNPGQEAN